MFASALFGHVGAVTITVFSAIIVEAAMGAGTPAFISLLFVLRNAPVTARRRRHTALSSDSGSWTRRRSRMLAGVPRVLHFSMVGIPVRLNGDNPDVHGHVVPQIFVSGNKGDAALILKADTARSAVVDAVEVLDRCDNRVGGIMRVDLNTHRYTCSNLGVLIEQQLKGDVLGCRVRSRAMIMRLPSHRSMLIGGSLHGFGLSLSENWQCQLAWCSF